MKKRVVIALGGNALGKTPQEQLELVKTTAKNIVDLVELGNNVIVTHGNGPQVGMINLAMEIAKNNISSPLVPFAECGAMSQGYIGYHLQQSIQEELYKRKLDKDCATVITQVEVDEKDEAFQKPTKPIGSFYSKEEADILEKEKNYVMKEDAGRGYRRVIASPIPIKILELRVIRDLIDKGDIVIACGGGGIPVTKDSFGYKGVDAVIDKDRTSARLALDVGADVLLILTAVDCVLINYNKENEQKLDSMNVTEAKKYIDDGEFAEGSMLPKVEACIEFVQNAKNKNYAIITSLTNALKALEGRSGTIIKKE